MNLFIYSDESGVFDKYHNDVFVFAGVICIESRNKEKWCRLYSAAEKTIRSSGGYSSGDELKATVVTNGQKGKLFRSVNNCYKFSTVIDQKRVLPQIFGNKKDKQRFLDYAYKIAVKNAFCKMISDGLIDPNAVNNLYFYVDEHTTATNGRYELREGLEQEFKNGTYNYKYDKFYPPIFTALQSVSLDFCNSKNKLLVRAADLLAGTIRKISLDALNDGDNVYAAVSKLAQYVIVLP